MHRGTLRARRLESALPFRFLGRLCGLLLLLSWVQCTRRVLRKTNPRTQLGDTLFRGSNRIAARTIVMSVFPIVNLVVMVSQYTIRHRRKGFSYSRPHNPRLQNIPFTNSTSSRHLIWPTTTTPRCRSASSSTSRTRLPLSPEEALVLD